MAITNYLVHFKTNETFEANKDQLRNDAVAFVGDATIIHTHKTDYYCGSGPVALKSDLANYATTSALTSELSDYLPLSGGTMTGNLDMNGHLIWFDGARSAIKVNAGDIQIVHGYNSKTYDFGEDNLTVDGVAVSLEGHTHTISQVSGLQDELDSKLESADLSGYALKTDIPSLSGGASATSGQYVSGVTVSGHEITVTKATLPVTTLSSLGITVTAAELNYMDGVTSSVQTQLNEKQDTLVSGESIKTLNGESLLGSGNIEITSGSSEVTWDSITGKPSTFAPTAHTHVFDDLILTGAGDSSKYLAGNGQFYTIRYNELSGKVPYNDLPVGTTSGTVAAGNHEHDQYLTSASLNGYATQSWVQDRGYATTTDLNNYFLKTGGTISGAITVEGAITLIEGGVISCAGQDTLLWNDNTVLTENNWEDYITISSTDTKNTTGTSNSTSKLYLAGGTSQSDTGVVTYSNANVYTKSGQLYANQMNATNGFYETSDARLKNFKDDIKALDVVFEIPTKYFTWKSDKSKTEHIGTSAQEIQKLYPDLVTENEDRVLSVDYARLSVIALAAIKELKKEIDELKSKN